uniref:Uncharacterized protein n=1 Tax=Rhizophora mucronata TaxID=61149 RepID=A0A2P2QXC0_RHIMU
MLLLLVITWGVSNINRY